MIMIYRLQVYILLNRIAQNQAKNPRLITDIAKRTAPFPLERATNDTSPISLSTNPIIQSVFEVFVSLKIGLLLTGLLSSPRRI